MMSMCIVSTYQSWLFDRIMTGDLIRSHHQVSFKGYFSCNVIFKTVHNQMTAFWMSKCLMRKGNPYLFVLHSLSGLWLAYVAQERSIWHIKKKASGSASAWKQGDWTLNVNTNAIFCSVPCHIKYTTTYS